MTVKNIDATPRSAPSRTIHVVQNCLLSDLLLIIVMIVLKRLRAVYS